MCAIIAGDKAYGFGILFLGAVDPQAYIAFVGKGPVMCR